MDYSTTTSSDVPSPSSHAHRPGLAAAAAVTDRSKPRYSPCVKRNICLLSLTKKGGSLLSKLMLPRAMATSMANRELAQRAARSLKEELGERPSVNVINEPYQVLECPSCEGFMNKPVCLPCGHSMCKSCLEKPTERNKDTVTCCSCKQVCSRIPIGFQSCRNPTLLIQNVSEKWYPNVLRCCLLREEGNKMANEKKLSDAIVLYTKALECGFVDHRMLSNRSKVYLDSGALQMALQDAEMCCIVRPQWSKGHYRRGVVLEQMDRFGEAAGAYVLCVHYGPGDLPVLKLLQSVIEKLLKESSSLDEEDIVLSVVGTAKRQLEELFTKHNEGKYSHTLSLDRSLMDVSDFECILCASLLYRPITVPCGHSFCQSCLARTFDHTPYCPVCRSPLGETFHQHTENSGRMVVDLVQENLIQLCFPHEYKEKCALIEQELMKASRVGMDENQAVPIFVCTVAFPGIPCPLHIFEPRYRLMMRRCIETNSRRFGMCLTLDDKATLYADVGTILFISSLEYTPDGRSLVTTIGEKRFRVVNKKTEDGYAKAEIQFLLDELVQGKENIDDLRSLQQSVYSHAMQWFHALPAFTRLRIVQNVCVPPPSIDPTPEACPNGPAWVWWFVNVVPTSPQTKLAFLSSVSLRERLLMLREALPLPTIT